MGGAHTAPWKQDSCQDLGSSLTLSCLSPPGNRGQRNMVTVTPPPRTEAAWSRAYATWQDKGPVWFLQPKNGKGQEMRR